MGGKKGPRQFRGEAPFLPRSLTVIVAGGHHRVQMLRTTVLRDDAEARQVTVATGDVQSRVTAVVHQRGVAAGHQQALAHVRLVRYDRQVERSLEWAGDRCVIESAGVIIIITLPLVIGIMHSFLLLLLQPDGREESRRRK